MPRDRLLGFSTLLRVYRRTSGMSVEEVCSYFPDLTVRTFLDLETGRALPSLTKHFYDQLRETLALSDEEDDLIRFAATQIVGPLR